MPGTPTPKHGITTMLGTDLASSIDDTHNAAMATIDGVMATIAQGTFAARPAAGKSGRLFHAQDTGQVFLDTGSAWLDLATVAALTTHALDTTDVHGVADTSDLVRAVAAEPTLRVVRGMVNANGTVNRGAGFTAVRQSVGFYAVSFTPTFAGAPDVEATLVDDDVNTAATIIKTSGGASNSVGVFVRSPSAEADSRFSFQAIGPA